jgi:predicted O-linked N-acetylglucosamine transferase (SPINDLY family)
MEAAKKQEVLSKAFALHQAGNLNDAETLYKSLLASDPRNETILNLLGTACLQKGNLEEGVRLLKTSLQVNPRQPDVYGMRGNALRELKQYDDALVNFNRALTINPEHLASYNFRALTFQEMKRYAEALADYDKLIALKPDYMNVYYSRGLLLQEMKRYAEAFFSYDKAIAATPDNALAYNNRGTVLRELKQYADALASYDKAITLRPDYADAYNNRGDTLRELKRYDEALVNIVKAIEITSNNPIFYYNHGLVLQEMKRYTEALASYDKSAALNPNDADVYDNRGIILLELKRYEEALLSFGRAIVLNPEKPYLEGVVLHTKIHLCDWQGNDAAWSVLEKKMEAGKLAMLPFHVLSISSSIAQQRKCAELFVKDKGPPQNFGLWNGEKYAHDKIRVAYVSADFREHPLSFLMAGVFEKHDRNRFEVYGIALKPEDQSETSRRVKAAFDQFIDVSQKDDKEVAHLLHDMEIDIAVDVMGFTLGARPSIFAYRPVPVQVNYLGYPATMAAPYIDYIIADNFIIPPEHRAQYSEKVIYMPDCFQANDDKRFVSGETPSRAQYGLPEKGFVFCSFNNSYKITPAFFDIWMRLLKAVPDSVLWLLGGNNIIQRNLSAEAGKRGIDPSRLIFAKTMKYSEHLTRLQCADLFLDTLPFNAGTTASDALWAGLPLLTCAGEAFASRMAGSLLSAMELPELIAKDLSDYEARALELATEPQKLAALKAKVAQNRGTSPLFDTALFTKHLEDAYTVLRDRTNAGLEPDDIHVKA